MLVHVDGKWVPAGIATGYIVPHSPCARREPAVVGVDEQAVGVVRIDREALLVPVLRVVEAAVTQRWALRSSHERPRAAAVRACPNAQLAAGGAAAVAGRVSGDRLHMCVDDIRVTRRDC